MAKKGRFRNFQAMMKNIQNSKDPQPDSNKNRQVPRKRIKTTNNYYKEQLNDAPVLGKGAFGKIFAIQDLNGKQIALKQ